MTGFETGRAAHEVRRVFVAADRRAYPAHVYVVVHEGLGAAKVGVSWKGRHDYRVREHIAYGWREHDRMEFHDRLLAEAVESGVIRSLRARGLPPCLTATQMPQGGATETVALAEMPAEQLWALVESTAARTRIEYVVRQ
ncbi:hypothetical protein [Kitasatospora sp. NBC_01300]|uniref:hypothetical protein n=1 Tax=Kitasatospora sp. NBC_01300 TaxID=2903574 RepID=UPI002F910C64|nr:hypothetical protein OG556_39680 [Kitasatospora sp. NBC_01300]